MKGLNFSFRSPSLRGFCQRSVYTSGSWLALSKDLAPVALRPVVSNSLPLAKEIDRENVLGPP